MRRIVLVVVAVCGVVFGTAAGLAAGSGTTSVKMTARLTAAKSQTVKAPNASGRFSGTLVRYTNGRSRLTWTLAYQNMSSRVLRAEVMTPPIHNRNEVSVILCQRQQCKASGRGVVFPILRRSTTALFSRTAYVVVYTKKNPKGEIQSRVTKVG